MKQLYRPPFLIVLMMGLLACRVSLSTRPSLFTETPPPTQTFTPAIITLIPTLTDTPVPPTEALSPGLPMPSGTPMANWDNIPVMPKALAGEERDGTYTYVVESPVEEVAAFYDAQLTELGWEKFATGQGESGARMMIFVKGTDMLTVSIIPAAGNTTLVILLKQST